MSRISILKATRMLLSREPVRMPETDRPVRVEYSTREEDALRSLAARLMMPFWDSVDMEQYSPALELFPFSTCRKYTCVLLTSTAEPGAGYVGLLGDPLDQEALNRLEGAAASPVEQVFALPSTISTFLDRCEQQLKAVDSLIEMEEHLQNPSIGQPEVLSLSALAVAGSQVVKIVNSVLYDAVRSGVSDVHFESGPTSLTVKYRIDGLLEGIKTYPGKLQVDQVMSRLKVLAELDISESRIPQDGSFRVSVDSRDVDLRVSIMPSVHGEDAVIRILDKRALLGAMQSISLNNLGFDSSSVLALRALMTAPYGMTLVTGPTGSGKTTTLYGLLAETNTGKDKIITIEDPVEYQLPGVLQIPVNEKKGLTFARGLRSILRHDPDTIMIGEIRDRETAEIAVQSALTGHVVLTTVHANNVFDVFGRFTHMGVDPFSLVAAMNGVWAQRLVRTICFNCAVEQAPNQTDLLTLQFFGRGKAGNFKVGTGCVSCRGTGYKGRRAVAEILALDDEMRELIVERAPIRRLRQRAREKGSRALVDAALDLVTAGHTTLEEIRRVSVTSQSN